MKCIHYSQTRFSNRNLQFVIIIHLLLSTTHRCELPVPGDPLLSHPHKLDIIEIVTSSQPIFRRSHDIRFDLMQPFMYHLETDKINDGR